MNLFSIAGLSVGVSCAILSLITLFFGKTKLHRLLLFFNIVVAVWGFGLFLVGIANTEPKAVNAWKIAHLGGFFVGPSFYHMVSHFCEIKRKKILYFAYLQALFFIPISFGTDHIINKVRLAFGLYFHEANPLYALGVIIYLFLVILSYYELFRFLKKTRGQKRIQTLYIIFGFMIGFVGANFTFLPMFRIDIFYPFGNFGITLYAFILTYSILRHRLMDIHLIFRRTMVYSLSAGLLTGLFVVLVLAMTNFLSDVAGQTSWKVTIIAALIIALLFNPLKNKIQLFIDKVFYKTTYDYYYIIQKTGRELVKSIKAGDIHRYIIDTLFTTLKIRTAYLLSTDNKHFKAECYRLIKYKPCGENITRKIDSDSELIKLLEIRKDIIIKDELPDLIEQDSADIITKELTPFKGEVIVPIFVYNKLAFILILGEKLSGDIYSDEDINMLSTIANQAAISLKNATLYADQEQRVEERPAELLIANQQLQQEISERVRAEKALKKAKEEAEMANLAKSQFLANMSHELRTPMNVVLGFADLLRSTHMEETQRDYVESIASSGQILLSLINDILDFSKIEAGEVEMEAIDFDIKQLAESTLKIIRPKINESGVEMVFDISEDMPIRFISDPICIRQILLNLLSNAAKFTHQGEIKLSLTDIVSFDVFQGEDIHNVKISVKDTGIGVAKDKQKTIFDIFSQEDSSTTRKYGGTGLGLTIVKRLVEFMGGDIKLISEKGKGSEFIVTLPMRAAEFVKDTDIAPPTMVDIKYEKVIRADAFTLKGLKVLLAEDNAGNLRLVNIQLDKFGCYTDIAVNGQEAIQKVKENKYDVVLMDIQMPAMSGIEAAEIIRRDVNKDIPIIAITAAIMEKDRENSMASGMNDYLTKPIESDKLKEMLLKWTRCDY